MIEDFWTVERVANLRALWANGKTGREIAVELGTTRSAVLGKANRIGLSVSAAERRSRITDAVKASYQRGQRGFCRPGRRHVAKITDKLRDLWPRLSDYQRDLLRAIMSQPVNEGDRLTARIHRE